MNNEKIIGKGVTKERASVAWASDAEVEGFPTHSSRVFCAYSKLSIPVFFGFMLALFYVCFRLISDFHVNFWILGHV